MQMKKGMSCLFAVLLAVLITGCTKETLASDPIQPEEPTTLRIGISPDYAPFAFLKQDETGNTLLTGADAELGRYIAQQLELEPEFVEMDFEACLDAVEKGEVDLILGGMLPLEMRRQRMDFTDAYYKPGAQVLVVKKEQAEEFETLDAFSGKTVAARYGTLQAQLVTEQLPESYMELTATIAEEILLLRSGQIDAAALDQQVAEDYVMGSSELVCAKAVFSYEGQEIAGGVPKGETELLQSVNEILKTVREEKLYLKWLDEAFLEAKEDTKR